MTKKKKTTTSEELVTKPSAEIAVYDYGQYANAGFEDTSSADFLIPLYTIIQPMSGIATAGDGTPGHWLNSATQETKEEIYFIPVATRRVYDAWVPRKESQGVGGYRGEFDPESDFVMEALENAEGERNPRTTLVSSDGTQELVELVETFKWFGVEYDHETDEVLHSGVIVPFSKTKIKSYKGAMTRMRTICTKTRSPLWANALCLRTERKTNSKGVFWVPLIEPADPRGSLQSMIAPDDERFAVCVKLRDIINSGEYTQDVGSAEPDESDNLPF